MIKCFLPLLSGKLYIKNSFNFWLKLMCLAIICMIFIGGLTRLTNSGLSITEWKPISGIIPPFSKKSWAEEFNKYKQSPEYLKINNNIGLNEFKSIFWMEFIHRIAGRIIGLLYIIPLIYFIFKGRIRERNLFIYIGGLILLIGQGFAGWYMVKSGLISNPYISHFRLAIHLLLAIFLYTILFWQLLRNSCKLVLAETKINSFWLNFWLNITLVFLFIQITLGALVAGLDAGLVYNHFPLMGDSLIPREVVLSNLGLHSFSDPVFVQFIHRIFALFLTVAILFTSISAFKIQNLSLSRVIICMIFVLFIQIMLGILTLIYMVPTIIALLHQLVAVILLSVILWTKYIAMNLSGKYLYGRISSYE